MSPQEALKMLDEALSTLNAPRTVHIQLTQAVAVVMKGLKPCPACAGTTPAPPASDTEDAKTDAPTDENPTEPDKNPSA